MKANKIALLRDVKVSKALLQLGIPTMIGMLVSALYNVADAYFVGRLGTSQVAAIAVTFPIIQIVIGIGMTFGTGAASYISRLLGEKNFTQANITASTAVFGVLLLQTLLIVVSIAFIEPILNVLGASATILPYAKTYSLIYIGGTLITVFYVAMNNIVTAEGAAKLTMIAMLIGSGLNILFDPIFIYTFNMGIAGAAWATVLAQAITAVLYIVYLLKKKGQLQISIRLFRFNKLVLTEILKIGIPVFLFQLLFGISQGMTNSAANEFGDTAIAAVGIVIRILAVGTFVIFGFVKGFQPLAGYSYGAKNFTRLKQSINLTLKWTSCFAVLFAMAIILFPNTIMQWFSTDETVISIGSKMLFVNGIVFVFFGFQAVYSSLFLALGKAKEGGILSISRSGLFFIPSILVLPHFFDLDGVIYAQAIADILTILLTALFMVKLNKKMKNIR